MPSRTESIKAFLIANTHPDLAAMYNHDMECQVTVAQDDGEAIEGEFAGTKWRGFTDGDQKWKPFRIPRQAYSDPVYDDVPMTYNLDEHAEAIGMTGWDWVSKCSRWVAYDFDAITGHSDKHHFKLDQDELKRVKDMACSLPWVTVRHSTSGQGLHLYVQLDQVATSNHTEHQALGRAILAKMSALAGYDFTSKVDICGGNMWIWHRKMKGTNGLKIIKSGDALTEVPENWRDHLHVVKGNGRKIKHNMPITGQVEKFEQLSGQRNRVKLDDDHMKLIHWLNDNSRFFWWDADNHMLVTHVLHLKHAHETLTMKGIFETLSDGRDLDEQNCFAFPMRRGAWAVRRYSLGAQEHPSWDQDGQQWTKCFLNLEPSLRTAAMANNGLEDPSGGFVFTSGADAKQASIAVGANVDIPASLDHRQATIKPHKDGKRVVVEFPRENSDQPIGGWLQKGNKWVRVFGANLTTQDEMSSDDFDDVVRHLVDPENSDSGWVLNSDDQWHDEPLNHVRAGLESMGLKPQEVKTIIGGNVFKPWKLVNKPFEPQYPGDRQWNRRAPQLRFVPSEEEELIYPSWMKILHHIGRSLDHAMKESEWAKSNGILTGADYLKCWIASMIQFPLEPLPYLFIYSQQQNTGKSILHEALSLLFRPGYQRADQALVNTSSFNGELEGAVLCVVEETDLNKNQTAYNRIKDWVTARSLPIHRKLQTPYHIDNSTHWIQCANSRQYCPIFTGDTRITLIHVPQQPVTPIPKRELLRSLDKEAPDFLGALLKLEVPPCRDRLFIPVIETDDKVAATDANKNALEVFIDEQCFFVPGECVLVGDFYKTFMEWLDPTERFNWASKQRVSKVMPDRFPKGRLSTSSHWHWGNISFTDKQPNGKIFVARKNVLIEVPHE